jgi:hypothetical protein
VSNDARINRSRQESIRDAINRIPSSPPDGARSLLVTTTTFATYPTTAGVFYAVLPTDVTGAETEGATPTFTQDSQLFYALNIGAGIPPNSTTVLAEMCGGIWVVCYG